MIRYECTEVDLKKKVGDKWLAKAKARTAALRKKKKFAEKSSIWSEVKHHYMELQGASKCVPLHYQASSGLTKSVVW